MEGLGFFALLQVPLERTRQRRGPCLGTATSQHILGSEARRLRVCGRAAWGDAWGFFRKSNAKAGRRSLHE